jgi:uncharacterized protein (DUF58 family)
VRGRDASSQVAGYLLHKAGLLLLVAVLLLAAWTGQVPIATLTSLFLALALLARAWNRLSLNRVSCHQSLSQNRVFPGESTELTLQVVNRKPLPLPWFQLAQEMPLAFAGDVPLKASPRPGVGVLCHEGALLWYRSIRWRCRLTCNRRGYHRIGPAAFSSGDLFGLYSRSMRVPIQDEILVYPRIFPVDRLGIPSLQPAGDFRTLRRMVQDPTRPTGVRNYRFGDSPRHIHWKASARTRELQVKVFESTTSFKAALFLCVESFRTSDAFAEEDFELAVSTAASVAHLVVGRGSPVGVFVNSRAADSGHAVSLAPAGRREQLTLILESLAKVTDRPSEAFDSFLERERGCLTAGATLILIYGRPPESMAARVAALKVTGYRVLVLLVGEGEEFEMQEGIDWMRIRNPHDLTRAG